MQLAPDFSFRPLPDVEQAVHFPFPNIFNPLGPLRNLVGTWTGPGFNAIWRPHFQQQDRFLELNVTQETLEFDAISGPIPNRGLLQHDMNMFGLTYLQQIKDASNNAGLHIEPGIWATVPATTNPAEPSTVVRMASIPHGTTMLAQGSAITVDGPPQIADVNLIPFGIGAATPPSSQFGTAEQTFKELNLSIPSTFRLPASPTAAGITQAMVINPNIVLKNAIAGQTITHMVVLQINTAAQPILGGGTSNTAFLQGGPAGPNAVTAEVDAIFWIETVKGQNGAPDFLQLQYSQRVLLNFNGLSWPHISVATLRKKAPVHIPVQFLDPHIPIELLRQADTPIPHPGPVEVPVAPVAPVAPK